jgi:hypothetical protein
MTNIEHRIERLENTLNPKDREIWLICVCNEGENQETKQTEALKAYNKENGTTLTEHEVNWLMMTTVYTRKGLPPTE